MKKILFFCLAAIVAVCCFVSCSNDVADNSAANIAVIKANAYGEVGAALSDAIARQPEAVKKLQYVADIAEYYIENSGEKAGGVGTAAKGAIEAVARQPEVTCTIVASFINTCEKITGFESRFGGAVNTAADLVFKSITDLTNEKYRVFVSDEAKIALLIDKTGNDFIFLKEDNTTPTEFGDGFIYLR